MTLDDAAFRRQACCLIWFGLLAAMTCGVCPIAFSAEESPNAGLIQSAGTKPWDNGPLRIDANHFIKHENGKPFVYLADTAWRIWTLDPAEVRRYLDSVRDAGFTVVQVAAVYQRAGKSFGTPENYAGERPFTDDAGTFNEPYWNHLDYIIRQAEARDLYVCLFAVWGYSAGGRGKWPLFGNPSVHNLRYGKNIGRRYREYPNIIWCVAGEFVTISGDFRGPITPKEKNLLIGIARGIRDQDGNHLMSIHGNQAETARPNPHFNNDSEIDFYLNQVSARHQLIDVVIEDDWRQPKATLLGENRYEAYPRGFPWGPSKGDPVDAWATRYFAYWSVFRGGLGYGYGHHWIWQFGEGGGQLDDAWLRAEGRQDMRHLRTLLERHPNHHRVCDQTWIADADKGSDDAAKDLRLCCRDTSSCWGYVYITKGHAVTIDMSKIQGTSVVCRWFDPRNGRFQYTDGTEAVSTFPARGTRKFDPAGAPAARNDWILILEAGTEPRDPNAQGAIHP